jgi:hypothetical protein
MEWLNRAFQRTPNIALMYGSADFHKITSVRKDEMIA